MLRAKPTTYRKRQRGLATVEFAITAPLLLLLMLATAELGRAFSQYNTLTKLARDGARYVSTVALTSAGVMDLTDQKVADTQNLVVFGNKGGTGTPLLSNDVRDLAIEDVQVTESLGAPLHVQVTVTFPYTPFLAGPLAAFGLSGTNVVGGFNMTATVTMRAL